jgi:hypothetical protein
MRQRNGRKNRAGCGNDGAVETMENQTTVFHRSHRSLEIRRTAPDSHIPTASTTGLFFSSRTRKPSRSSGALRARNPSSQSYPMQDDPGGEPCFQCSMILKEGCVSFGEPARFRMLRGE